MALKVYVAGRITRQNEVRKIIHALRSEGIEITRDWTWETTSPLSCEQDSVEFRKKEYATLNSKYHEEADSDLKAVLDADVFIILTDEHGSSMYVEMGAAFAARMLRNKPQALYAIGPYFDRMVFYQHRGVHRVGSVEEIIVDLKKRELLAKKS